MYKRDKIFVAIFGAISAGIAFSVNVDYSRIASEGLTLSSIVLAVYVAAMMGLIGSKLGEKMSSTVTSDGEHTQLWVFMEYVRNALFFAISTIIISSIVLLIPTIDPETATLTELITYRFVSAIGLSCYSVNLLFMGLVLKFMLNRQIWDT